MTLGTARIIRGTALALPLPDESVDLIVTSPPYFGLRSYQDRGRHYEGQIGAEPTPREFVDALIAATAEMIRVLKPSGSIWVNLGDKYNSAAGGGGNLLEAGHSAGGSNPQRIRGRATGGVPQKSLIGMPWRYALRAIDDLGLILRRDQIWCLSGGARVYARTARGDRPIMLRDLARAHRPQDVQVWNGERWTQVLGWNKTPDDEGALELELRTGERIGCTPGHQWPTTRGLLRAEDIRVGDVILTTRLPQPTVPRTPAGLSDDDIGWLIGLYVAEGSRSGTTVQFSGHMKEAARHARLARIAAAYDGAFALYQVGENVANATLRGSVIVGIIDRYVSPATAKTKRLTLAAWQRSDQFLAAVMDGYLSGDGHYDAKNDRWRLGFTANDEWAADLRTMAARLGTVLRLRRADHHGFGGTFPGWKGEWRWTRSVHGNAKADGEVVAIRRSRARDFYDLGVADDPHLFALASGVLTHNSKPNGLPESVTDRCRTSHEYWFHFTKSPRYFSAVDEIREETANFHVALPRVERGHPGSPQRNRMESNPLGKLPGSVWEIPTQPLDAPKWRGQEPGRAHVYFFGRDHGTVQPEAEAWATAGPGRTVRRMADHFAAFPMEWPRRIIRGWSPSGVCTACGEGRRPVVAAAPFIAKGFFGDQVSERAWNPGDPAKSSLGIPASDRQRTLTGYACVCPDTTAPTIPAVILDPFGGTGTTALAAKALGRLGISVDMSADYCRLATWRTTDPGQLASAMQVDKPAPVAPDQLDLLEGLLA